MKAGKQPNIEPWKYFLKSVRFASSPRLPDEEEKSKTFVKTASPSPVGSENRCQARKDENDMYEKLPQELKERGLFCCWNMKNGKMV